MTQIATLKGMKCPKCGSEHVNVTGTKGALGASLATGLAFGAIGNVVAGKHAAANTATEPLQYKCGACGSKFESLPLCAPPEEILSAPCNITFTRESSFVGAAVPQIVYLNGVKLGAVKNGASITCATENRYNTIFVTDQYGVAFRDDYRFEASPGGEVAVRFNRKFLNGSVMPPAPSAVTAGTEGGASAAAGPRAQITVPQPQNRPPARFCTSCGAPMEPGAQVCASCGAKRVDPGDYAAVAAARPERALTVFGLLAAAWLLLLLFQGIFQGRLMYGSQVTYLFAASMLGTSIYMLLQSERKYRQFAVAGGVLTALISTGTAMAVLANNMGLGAFSIPQVFDLGEPYFWRSLWRSLLTVTLAMGGAFGAWRLFKAKEKQPRLRVSAWTGAAIYGFCGIIAWIASPGVATNMAKMPFAAVLIVLFSNAADVLIAYLSVRFADSLCKDGRSRVELYGAGKAWAWIAAIAMCLSVADVLLIGFGALDGMTYTASLLLAVCGAAGYFLLLRNKRVGIYVIIAASVLILGGQFLQSLNGVFYVAGQFAPLLLGAILGSVNPLLAWLSVRSADRRGFSCQACAAAPLTTQKISGFQKFTAIFNIAAGVLLLIPAIINVSDGPEPAYVITFICLSAAYLTFGLIAAAAQRSCTKPYPAWMNIVSTVLFSLVVLLAVIAIVGLIVTALS